MDLRSLALFRISLSFFIILDLIVRSTSLRAQYTDFGFMPRGPLIEQFLSPWMPSLHLMSGQAVVQAVLFVLAGIFALMLLVGYRTWFATFFSWVMMVSLHNRNYMVLQSGDVLLHLLSFWGLFLPLGARCSVDRVLTAFPRLEANQKYFSSAGSFALFMQVAILYLFAVAHKLSPNAYPVWWKEGTAVQYALSLDQFATPLGYVLLHFPLFLKGLNYLTLLIETAGPLLLFCPFFNGPVRLFGIFLIILLQQGLNACLILGPFPWVASMAMLALLPADFWDWIFLSRRLRVWSQKLSAALTGRVHKISQNQWLQENIMAPYPPCPARLKSSPAGNLFALFCIIGVFFWNLGGVKPKFMIPLRFQWIGVSLGLDQHWKMFSPPHKESGWYVIPGKLKNGQEIDVFQKGGSVTWQKPKDVAAMYPNERWRKYMTNLQTTTDSRYRREYARYLCRNWNERHAGGEQLDNFEIFFMKELKHLDLPSAPPQKILLWKHYCFKVPERLENSPHQNDQAMSIGVPAVIPRSAQTRLVKTP